MLIPDGDGSWVYFSSHCKTAKNDVITVPIPAFVMKWVEQYLEAHQRLLKGHQHDGMWMTAPGLPVHRELRTDGKNGKNGAEFTFVMECIREFGGEKLHTLSKYTQLRTIWFEGNDAALVGSMHNLFANAQDVALESLNNKRRRTDVMSDKIAAQLRTDLTLDDSASLKMAHAGQAICVQPADPLQSAVGSA